MAEYTGASFTTVTAYTSPALTDLADIYSDSGMTIGTQNPFPCYGNYTFYGAAGLYVVKGDFTRLLGPGSSRQLWRFKAKTTATSGYPGNGFMLWDNATQTSATHLIFSHLTDDDLDIDLFLAYLNTGDTVIIQDADTSQNNQIWTLSGPAVNTNGGTSTSYWTAPVTLSSSAGTGTTGFNNNHPIIVTVFV